MHAICVIVKGERVTCSNWAIKDLSKGARGRNFYTTTKLLLKRHGCSLQSS